MSDLANILPAAALALLAGALVPRRGLVAGIGPRGRRRALLVAAWLGAMALALFVNASRFDVLVRMDDPYITYRYAENLAAGRGFVYNPGERVLGTSTPLLTLLLAGALAAVPGADVVGVAVALNHALFALAALLGVALLGPGLARSGDERDALPAQLFFLVCIALAPTFRTLMFGMEVGLVMVFATAAPLLVRERALLRWALTLFLLVLTRIDAALVAGLSVAHMLVVARDVARRRRLGVLALLAALLGGAALAGLLYFGAILPQSVVAKNAVAREFNQGGFAPAMIALSASGLARDLLWGTAEKALLFAAFCSGALVALRRRDDAVLFAAAAPLAYLSFLAVFQVTRAGSWYAPGYMLLYYVVCAYGFAAGVGALRRVLAAAWPGPGARAEPLLAAGLVGAVLLGIVTPALGTLERSARFYRRYFVPRDPLICLGRDLHARVAGPGERVLVGDIGKIGYYSGASVLDYVGIVSPEVLPYYRDGSGLFGILMGEEPAYAALRVPLALRGSRSTVPRAAFMAWLEQRYARLDTRCDPNSLGYTLFARRDRLPDAVPGAGAEP